MGQQVKQCNSLPPFLNCERGSTEGFVLLATVIIGMREKVHGERELTILTSSFRADGSGFSAEHRVKVNVKAGGAGWLRDGRCCKPWKTQTRR